jgi:SAM-dependent methyltransferase
MTFDRRKHWEQLYTTKSPLDASWYQDEPTVSLELVARTGAGTGARIVDVGGGASVLVDRLLARGYRNVAVLDISVAALEFAQARLGDRAVQVEWLASDIVEFRPAHTFDIWHDRAVFHFLTDAADRRAYVAAMDRALEPGGHVIIGAFALEGPRKCSGLDVVQYNADKLSAELGDGYRLVEQLQETHFTPTGKAQEFGFYRFVRSVQEGQIVTEPDRQDEADKGAADFVKVLVVVKLVIIAIVALAAWWLLRTI